jgi:benzoyl-CoA reductase/2-hydroxyglutaryl-CoA dehydratase subunit BcrC/BadD/HgdB
VGACFARPEKWKQKFGGLSVKDLKHLIYFENLLQEANNELVQKAKANGEYAIGYTCYFMPEVLLDLPGCFSVRLRAPRCTSPDIATYYMSARVCHYARSLLERALEGGFNFLDAQMATETCTGTCRFQEHLQQKHLDSVKDMRIINNDNFFCEFSDVPFKNNENGYAHFREQLRAHVLQPLHEKLGIDVSDEAIMKTIERHNEVCRLINEIGDYRKLDNPTITGYEFHVIQLVSQVCPKDLILPYLRETAEELKTREPDDRWPFRCKVVLAGSENDDPDFTKLIESCGAEVVADRYCYGAVESRIPIVVKEGQEPLDAIARHYLDTSNCPRFMPQDTMRARKQRIADLARDYHADGVIVASNKFCEYWSYERVIDTVVLPRDFGLPVCSIEKEYINSASGQLRTRFQAFVESIEIKKIQEGK